MFLRRVTYGNSDYGLFLGKELIFKNGEEKFKILMSCITCPGRPSWACPGRSSWASDVGAQDKKVSFPKIMPRKILWGYPGLARDSRTKPPLDLAGPLLTFLPGKLLQTLATLIYHQYQTAANPGNANV